MNILKMFIMFYQANNPSLWLDGLEGALASTEVSSISNIPVIMEEQIEIENQVCLTDAKEIDIAKEVPEVSTELEAVEEMEVDDQVNTEHTHLSNSLIQLGY